MTTPSESLGQILRLRRVTILLTLQQLAAKSGVSASHLGRIERGDRFPSAHILRKLAKPLGFDESELFSRAGYLSPIDESQGGFAQLDPYVATVLSREPVEIQRTVVAILSIFKSMAKGGQCNIEFREYAHSKYPEVDEDVITMIEDILEHSPREKAKKSNCPIGLDKIHCQNCYFWRDGKCDYHAIMKEHREQKGA